MFKYSPSDDEYRDRERRKLKYQKEWIKKELSAALVEVLMTKKLDKGVELVLIANDLRKKQEWVDMKLLAAGMLELGWRKYRPHGHARNRQWLWVPGYTLNDFRAGVYITASGFLMASMAQRKRLQDLGLI